MRVLLADDRAEYRQTLAEMVECWGYEVVECASESEARNLIEQTDVGLDIALVDMRMEVPDSGLSLIRVLSTFRPSVPVVLITAYADLTEVAMCMAAGAFSYVRKQQVQEFLERTLQRAVVERLSRNPDHHGALALADCLIDRLAHSSAEETRGLYVAVLVGKAVVLEALERPDDARRTYEMLLSEETRDDASVSHWSQYARTALALLEGKTGRGGPHVAQLVESVLSEFPEEEAEGFRARMQEHMETRLRFLDQRSRFAGSFPFLLTLRRWNSFTPILPVEDCEQTSAGGGYFMRVFDRSSGRWRGIVIDPGHRFLESFAHYGGRLVDIDDIILTHAHNDHTMDFEAVCTLLYEFNHTRGGVQRPRRAVRVYMNPGTFMKFSGSLDLRHCDYIERCIILNTGDKHVLTPDVYLHVLPAYHDEVISRSYAVGLLFDIGSGALAEPTSTEALARKRVLFTSDTGFYPRADDRGTGGADVAGHEITEEYYSTLADHGHPASLLRDVAVLVAHLGSVHPKELTREPLEPTERFYPNHLGVLGTVGVIHRMQPRLALISEFGEEMRHVRSRVVAGIGHACSSQANPGGQQAERPAVLPADLPLILDLADLRIYCVDTRRMEPFVDVKFCPHGGMFYYIRSRQSGHNVDMDDCVTAYEETLGLGYAGNRRPPHLLAS